MFLPAKHLSSEQATLIVRRAARKATGMDIGRSVTLMTEEPNVDDLQTHDKAPVHPLNFWYCGLRDAECAQVASLTALLREPLCL